MKEKPFGPMSRKQEQAEENMGQVWVSPLSLCVCSNPCLLCLPWGSFALCCFDCGKFGRSLQCLISTGVRSPVLAMQLFFPSGGNGWLVASLPSLSSLLHFLLLLFILNMLVLLCTDRKRKRYIKKCDGMRQRNF